MEKQQKQLEINKDYGFVFGLDSDKGQHLYYMGGNVIKAVQPGSEKEAESQDTVNKILAYINQPSVNTGTW